MSSRVEQDTQLSATLDEHHSLFFGMLSVVHLILISFLLSTNTLNRNLSPIVFLLYCLLIITSPFSLATLSLVWLTSFPGAYL